MLTNKKSILVLLVCAVLSVCVSAQNATADLTQRFLERANTQYENGDIDNAYKTINAALRLNSSDGSAAVPANVTIIATQIYSAVLDKIIDEKDYARIDEVTANLETYPVIADSTVQNKVKAVYAAQEADIAAKREAAEAAKQEELRLQYQQQLEDQRKNQESFFQEMAKNQESVMTSIVDLGDRLVESSEKSERSNHLVLIAILIVCAILVVVFIIVILGIITASKAAAHQREQFDATLKLVAGMQQANNQILLGNVTDLQGIEGLKSAGSSRWGVDALPAPEMSAEEKEELKQLAIKCEDLGSKIDQVSGRKNNSKNVSELVYKLAMKLGCNQNTSMLYFCAAMVYDVGFLSVPKDILEEETLDEQQRRILRDHINKYGNYLDFVPEKYKAIFNDAARFHHENEDGSGYPDGIAADKIPQIAKLIHVAESYNSLISRRTYRAIKDKESAVNELMSKPGMYDSVVVQALDSIV